MPLPPREVGKVSQIGNITASGTIGAASVDTDVRVITIAQTTPGLTLTLPNPGDTSALVGIDVENVGSASFAMYGMLVSAGSALRLVWTGSAWTPEPIFTQQQAVVTALIFG